MYDFLRGRLASKGEGACVLDVGGVGYRLLVSHSTLQRLPGEGEMTLLAHLLVREERMDLFGFATAAERHLFRQLLLVSGVGPSVAMSLLSAGEPELLAARIAAGDLGFLTRVKGIGRKTGERILVELRDRFQKEAGGRGGTAPEPAFSGPREDAVRALCSLGLPRAEAEERVRAVPDEGLGVEEMVKRALRRSR